jgi:hypothetical protein
LFWPESNTLFLEKFRSSSDKTLWLLIQATHELVELVRGISADQDKVGSDYATAKLKALRSFIEGFPKGEGKTRPQSKSAQVHRYECCRLTAILMTRMVGRGETWSDAANETTYINDIIFSLSNSDPEDLWTDHVGLLYWVSLIAYAVLHKTRYRLFGAGIVHRLISEVTFGDQDPRIGVHSLKTLGRFEEVCRIGE